MTDDPLDNAGGEPAPNPVPDPKPEEAPQPQAAEKTTEPKPAVEQPPEKQPEAPVAEPSQPEGEPAETIPESEPKETPDPIQARLDAVEKQNKELLERLDAQSKPPQPETPAKTPEQIQWEQARVQAWQRDNQILAEAEKLRNNADHRDNMIAEHGQEKVQRIIDSAQDIRNERHLNNLVARQRMEQEQREQERLVQQEWATLRTKSEAQAKNLTLNPDVFERDEYLKAYFSLPYPDQNVKQAIADRLFVLAHTKGIPKESQQIVTAERAAATKATQKAISGAPTNPGKMTQGQAALAAVQEREKHIDPLDYTE